MELRGKKWDNERALLRVKGKRPRSLELFDTEVDDTFLQEISSEKSLVSLHIASKAISDDGVIAIVKNCKLRSLMLSGVPKVSDTALDHISQCATLRELYLEGTSVTDRAIGLINRLPELWSLLIDNTKITDAGIHDVAAKTIKLVSFSNCAIQGDGFSSWRQADKMSFYTTGGPLNDAGFATACRSFTCMWNVIISNTKVSDNGIKALQGNPPTMLRINGTPITNAGVRWLIENLPIQGIDVDALQMSKEEASRYENYKGRYLQVNVCD
jgi:hypothetical protein